MLTGKMQWGGFSHAKMYLEVILTNIVVAIDLYPTAI